VPNQTAPLDAAEVRAALAGTRFADVRYLAQTGSTNADANALLGDVAARGATLVAEYQSAGAGRKGRRWFAPPGAALLFTAILPESIPVAALWAVPFWTALGVATAVERCCGSTLDLVWPNDLYARGGKTGGILCIARISGETAWAACGVGLNVVRPATDSDLATLDPQPVFLDDLAAGARREPVLAAILTTFDRTLAALHKPDAVAAAWADRAALAGTRYRYRNDADGIEREATAQRIGPHGELIVRDERGEHAIDMADVRVIGRG